LNLNGAAIAATKRKLSFPVFIQLGF